MFETKRPRTIAARRPISTAAPKRSSWLTFIGSNALSCFRSTQTHGYKFLVMPHRPKYESIFWIQTLIAMSLLTIMMILYAYIPMLEKPTLTTQMPFRQPVKYIPYPTVAFCSQNRISREALLNYSDYIFTEQKKHSVSLGNTREEIYENLRPLGIVYQTFLDTFTSARIDQVHAVLMKIYGGAYPLRQIMDDIAPKCSDLIQHCKWRGSIVNCTQYIQERHSFIGKCCYFNYRRPPKIEVLAFKQKQTPLKVSAPLPITRSGFEYGLTVVVNQRVEDYSHTVQEFIGTNVYLLESTVYLDEASGSVPMRILQPDEELFISVDAFVVNGSQAMRPYNPHLRDCFFPDETALGPIYTRSECILDCRVKDVIEKCGCLPVPFAEIYDAPDCLLGDLNCLTIWTGQWLRNRAESIFAKGDTDKSAEPKCPHCLRRCTYMKYIPSTSKADFDPINHNKMSDRDNFLNTHDMRGHSIVHINFKHSRLTQYGRTVAYMWFDLFGMFGGLCGLTFGGSIISVIELIYYGTGRFGAQFTRKICSKRWPPPPPPPPRRIEGNNNQSVSSSRPPPLSIYFNELVHYKNKRVEQRMPLQRSQQLQKFNAALIELP